MVRVPGESLKMVGTINSQVEPKITGIKLAFATFLLSIKEKRPLNQDNITKRGDIADKSTC